MKDKYILNVAGLTRELKLCKAGDDLYIAAFTFFGDVELACACAGELIKKLPEHDLLITAESKGIPLVHEMARQLGVNTYLLARKSPKLYMKEPISVEVKSITTERLQHLYIDKSDAERMKGKRVVVVDDVVSTGESMHAVEQLVRQSGGEVVGRMAILGEGDAAGLKDVTYLAHLPLFTRAQLEDGATPDIDPEARPNEGKSPTIEAGGQSYLRLAVQTHIITDGDDIADVAKKYAGPHVQPGDVVFISEKAVACSQKRAVRMVDIKPRKLAKFLTRFVYKSPYGIGLGIPETMEMALRECGTMRILFAAFVSALGKLLRRRGWFYKVAGPKAESIDGPTPYTLPPYNEYVVLGPDDPDAVAGRVAEKLGCEVAIVDINDLKGKVLGATKGVDRELTADILRDNPLGQSGQRTPIGIIRKQ